jgi:hypothetical protein
MLAAEASYTGAARNPHRKPVNLDQNRQHDSATAEQKTKRQLPPKSGKFRALCEISTFCQCIRWWRSSQFVTFAFPMRCSEIVPSHCAYDYGDEVTTRARREEKGIGYSTFQIRANVFLVLAVSKLSTK